MGEKETQEVLDDVAMERSLQRGRWGDEFDDKLSDAWWGNMLGTYLGRVQAAIFSRGEKPTEEASLRYIPVEDSAMRADLIKVAAIAVCYVEVIDRRKDR
jgi:hypothetical protein